MHLNGSSSLFLMDKIIDFFRDVNHLPCYGVEASFGFTSSTVRVLQVPYVPIGL